MKKTSQLYSMSIRQLQCYSWILRNMHHENTRQQVTELHQVVCKFFGSVLYPGSCVMISNTPACYSLSEQLLSLLIILCWTERWVGELIGEERSEEVKEEVRLVRCNLNSAVKK